MGVFVHSQLANHTYLKCLSPLIDGDLKLYVDDAAKVDRLSQDGITTGFATIAQMPVAFIYQDFRVNGASVSKTNAKRMMAFCEEVIQTKRPLIFLMNSLGVRITQGRTIFNDAFSMIPMLFKVKKEVPLITAAFAGTIGINAIYFAQGHYRISVASSPINLAGPEVHKRFFGDKNLTYQKFAAASHQFRLNTLVHETVENTSELLTRIKTIVTTLNNEKLQAPALYAEKTTLTDLLKQLGDDVIELFPLKGKDVKVYIGKIGTHKVGYLVNPPQQPNNLLTVASMDKALAAMDLFKSLKIPVISLLDCPGGDPRQGESDANGLLRMTELAQVMIDYPYKKMGIINGRCFGGSGMFCFPHIFGGHRVLAVEGSQVGIMNDVIIKELLSGSPRLYQEWEKAHVSETADLKDLIEAGTIDRIIARENIGFEIKVLLLENLLEQGEQASYELPTETIKLA